MLKYGSEVKNHEDVDQTRLDYNDYKQIIWYYDDISQI